jgi:hypothetical protein
MIQNLTTILPEYFLNPIGLIALAALIPLIIFYLTRPKPKRKVMPSMKFFNKEKNRSRIQNALRKLRSNLLLIINILALVLMSSAIAGLYLQGSTEGKSVVIYDRSASMMEEHQNMISTVKSQAGTSVTLIEASNTVKVKRDMNRGDAANYIEQNPPKYTEADLSAAISRAQQFDGNLIILSDLDAQKSTVEAFRNLGGERGLRQIDYSTENSWGFVDVTEEGVEIRNYRNTTQSVELEINERVKTVNLEPESNNLVKLNYSEGENFLELESDGFSPDNKAYVLKPENRSLKVEYRGPDNPHLMTALDLVENVESGDDGELLILNDESIDPEKIERPVIMMQGASSFWNNQTTSETEVEFRSFNTAINSEVYGLNASESKFTRPENAVFTRGDRGYYNVEDSKLREKLTYPVIWKKLIDDVAGIPSFETVNNQIVSGQHEPGFKDRSAYSFLNQEESTFEPTDIEGELQTTGASINQASLLSTIILILLTVETLIIAKRGVYEQ